MLALVELFEFLLFFLSGMCSEKTGFRAGRYFKYPEFLGVSIQITVVGGSRGYRS